MLKTVQMLHIIVHTMMHDTFLQIIWLIDSPNKQPLFEVELFYKVWPWTTKPVISITGI